MPGHKNKSYKIGFHMPRTFKDNYPALDSSYPNFLFRDSAQTNDFPTDKSTARRKLPPIPSEMDNNRVLMISDKKNPMSPLVENTRYSMSDSLFTSPSDSRPPGYQMSYNPLYNSSTTTLDSESSPAPVRYISSSTDADESSLDQVSQNMDMMSLGMPPELTSSSTKNPLFNADINDSVNKQDILNNFTDEPTEKFNYFSQKTQVQSYLDKSPEPFIPEPDYDEDEFTIDFKSEDTEKLPPNRNSDTLVYKDYDGEDFGQYLPEEEEYLDNIGFTWRKNIRNNYSKPEHTRKARTEIKRQRTSSQRTVQKLFKSAPKMKGNTMRQNLRDFSFADARISLGNTVRHSQNNRYKKNTEVTAEDEQFLQSRNSYEQYLRTRFSQNMETQSQNWSQKELNSQTNFEKTFGLDFTGRVSKRFKMSKDTIVGRLTTKFWRKSESSFKIPEN